MNKALTTSLNDLLQSFKSSFTTASSAFVQAGKIYAQAIAEHGDTAREQFAAAIPQITASTWRRLELVGNGGLDPRLVGPVSAGGDALRRLPVHLQTSALDSGVDLLVSGGDMLRVQVDNLTPQQARQVFARDHIRDAAAQRAWLESETPISLVASGIPKKRQWSIKDKRIVVSGPCEFTLMDLMAEMG